MTGRDSALPDFIDPMLSGRSSPFDSDEHLFDVKWDGIRAIALRDTDGYRIHNRNRRDLVPTYPELECLSALPPGTVLDGEVVALCDDRPDFETVMTRDRVRDPRRARSLVAVTPISLVVFDQLYDRFEDLTGRPLAERRAVLENTITTLSDRFGGHVAFSAGVVGPGRDFFREVTDRGLEGLVAKRLDGRYLRGERSDLWLKIKRQERRNCVIVGYLVEGRDLRSLLVAADVDGELRYLGRVGSGLSDRVRHDLLPRLERLMRDEPLIPCDNLDAIWVDPALFCVVRYVELTHRGHLRAPVFEQLIEEPR